MSHFSTIQTKIKEKPQLIEALNLLAYWAEENKELKVTGQHAINHPTVDAEVLVTKNIGFRLTEEGTYELVTDLELWEEKIPVARFIDKVTQQYARMTIHDAVKQQGLAVAEEWEMDDNSIELTVTMWD